MPWHFAISFSGGKETPNGNEISVEASTQKNKAHDNCMVCPLGDFKQTSN